MGRTRTYIGDFTMNDEEEYILTMPKVRTSDSHYIAWDRENIIHQILTDTQLCEKFYGYPPASRELAEDVASSVEEAIEGLDLKYLKSSMVREFVCLEFLKRGMIEYHNACMRVGTSLHDAHAIDIGDGYGARDNANLQANPETSHKHKADKMSKEQYLLMMPPKVADAHLKSYIHIHDLEYFGSRSFCMDSDLRYLYYYGFMPDGKGSSASVSAPAKNPEVAVLHAVKYLAASQTNFAGGQGYYNFLTFIAPYFEGLDYIQIKQYMQMMVYELTQMMVARGGQSCHKNTLVLVKNTKNKMIEVLEIGKFCHKFVAGEGSKKFEKPEYLTLSLNKKTGDIEWKPITGVYVHKPATQLKKVSIWSGRDVTVTSDHSLFTLDESANFVETKPTSNPNTIICVNHIPIDKVTHNYTPDEAWAFGVMIGDGNVIYSNDIITGVAAAISNEDVKSKFVEYLSTKTTNKIRDERPSDDRDMYQIIVTDRSLGEYFSSIGRGAPNKQIPDDMLMESEEVLWALLDGLLSTDGNVSRRRYEYSTTSEKLARQIEFILNRLGIKYNIRKRNSKSNFNRNHIIYCIQICATDSANINIAHTGRQFESYNGVCQNKHDFSVLKPFIKKKYGSGLYKLNYIYRTNGRKLKYDQLMLVKDRLPELCNKMRNVLPMEVKSIEDAPMEEFVYDIGVEDNENFILHNGIVAHNTVFSSLQLSPGVPTLWRDVPVVYKGRIWDGEHDVPKRTYGEFEREVRLAFKALMDVMIDGDYWGKPFNFPKPEISIEPDFVTLSDEIAAWDMEHPDIPTYKELYLMAFDLAAKFGTPYFDNQIPAYRGAGKGISCYQCLPEDTIVHIMRDNKPRDVPIKDLLTSDLILTPTRGYQPFEGILSKPYEGEMIEFVMRNRQSYSCTPDHSVVVKTINMPHFVTMPANEVSLDDEMVVLVNGVATSVQIECIHTIPNFRGVVYDPINVPGHQFVIEDGIVTGNCCAYNFSSNIDEDDEFYDKVYFRNGAHFSMGSLQVVTLNCPRAAYDSGGDVEKLVRNLKNYMNIARDVFVIKKRWIDEIIRRNRLPFVVQRPRDPITGEPGAMAVDMDGLVCTIGVLGFNEMVQHVTGYQLHESKVAHKTALYILAELNKHARKLSEESGLKIVVARTPAETTCQRFAVSDLLNPDYAEHARKVVKGDLDAFDRLKKTTRDLPVYYTNGTHVAVDAPISLPERIKIENPFFVMVQGGNIFHVWLGEAHPEPRGLYEFCMNIATQTQIGYFAFTRDMTIPVNRYTWYTEEFDNER